MHDHALTWRSARRILLLVLTALFAVGTVSSFAANTAPSGIHVSAGRPYRTANGIIVQAGTPLPIFAMQAPALSSAGVSNLAQLFSSIYNRQDVLADSYRSRIRYTVPNTATDSILEQYSATGGFYAYNAKVAFAETAQGTLTTAQAEQLACNFLYKPNSPNSSLIDVDGALLIGHATGVITPQATFLSVSPPGDCSKPGYKASLIWSNNETSGVQVAATPQAIGAVVAVTMTLNTGQFSQTPQVPLGGAGGHLSLLFRPSPAGGPPSFSLDTSVPGMAAIAMPFYGRSLGFSRNVPAVDPAQVQTQVEQQVRASFPDATAVNVPAPNLLYMVDEAGSPQKALEPALNFQGIQVTVGGVTFALKDINVPAVQSGAGGFGPNVSITSPASGTTFTPGSNVILNGSISGGVNPYTYTWELDDGTLLEQDVLASGGSVSLTTNQLPAVSHNGIPAATTVILRVTDSEGAVRTATVSLNPTVARAVFLPLIQRAGSAQAVLQKQPQASPALSIRPAAINYSFGIESGSDYPPYGPGGSDLPGVPPDANGFRSGMLSYGWNQRFYWSNASAWERDWRDCSLGGGDCTYGVDRADFVYYTGHGSNGGISLPSSIDSAWFPGTSARFSSLRWVGFSSCLTLRAQWPTPGSEPIRNWFNAFRGAHMLLGFNSLMADIAFGGPLVDNMRMPTFLGIPFPWAQRTIREAWVLTAFNMNAGKPAYIYAVGNGVNPVDNKLPLPTDPPLPRPYPVASWHWVWWDV